MDIGKISKKFADFTTSAQRALTKGVQNTQENSQEISKDANKAIRSYGLSSVVFKKTTTPKGELKINLKKYIEYLKKCEKERKNDYFVIDSPTKKISPIKLAKEILKTTNDKNLVLVNSLLKECIKSNGH